MAVAFYNGRQVEIKSQTAHSAVIVIPHGGEKQVSLRALKNGAGTTLDKLDPLPMVSPMAVVERDFRRVARRDNPGLAEHVRRKKKA